VEVFGGRGERVITDQIFPSEGSNGVAVYAKHGTAKLKALRIWQLDSIWRGKKKDPE
jgi:levanase